jgi:hypothetical protein
MASSWEVGFSSCGLSIESPTWITVADSISAINPA